MTHELAECQILLNIPLGRLVVKKNVTFQQRFPIIVTVDRFEYPVRVDVGEPRDDHQLPLGHSMERVQVLGQVLLWYCRITVPVTLPTLNLSVGFLQEDPFFEVGRPNQCRD